MLLATIGLDTKKIVSVRNDPNNEYGKTFLKKAFARVLFRLADGCVFQTSDAKNYFPKDNPNLMPIVTWRGTANIVFSNWLNYCVYQNTPYDLNNL